MLFHLPWLFAGTPDSIYLWIHAVCPPHTFFFHNCSHLFVPFPCHLGVFLKPISIWLIIFSAVSIPLLTVSMHFNLLHFLNYFLLSQYDVLLACLPLGRSSFISCLLPYPSALCHSQSLFLSPSTTPFLSLSLVCVWKYFVLIIIYLCLCWVFVAVWAFLKLWGAGAILSCGAWAIIAVASLVGDHGLQSMPVSAAVARGL